MSNRAHCLNLFRLRLPQIVPVVVVVNVVGILCKALTIPEHYLDVSHEKLFSGQLPTRIVIALVSNSALDGRLTANPLNLRHFDLSEIALSVV